MWIFWEKKKRTGLWNRKKCAESSEIFKNTILLKNGRYTSRYCYINAKQHLYFNSITINWIRPLRYFFPTCKLHPWSTRFTFMDLCIQFGIVSRRHTNDTARTNRGESEWTNHLQCWIKDQKRLEKTTLWHGV